MYLYLYSLNDPISSEVRYIGISLNPSRRYRQHLTCSINPKKLEWIESLKSQSLLPKMEILFKSEDINFILNKEIELIASFSNLFNISKGGEFNISFSDRLVKMYNFEGEQLNSFSSCGEALRFLNINDESSSISASALRIRNYAYGYIWRYDNDVITEDDFKRLHLSFENSRESKKVFVFDVDGNFIDNYESIEKCSKSLGIGRSGITGVLSDKANYSHKGYIFSQSLEDFDEKYNQFLDSLPESIAQYTLDGKCLNYFKSINSVATYFQTSCNNTIKKCCENKISSYKNYIFKYERVPPSKFKKEITHFSILDLEGEVIYNGSTESNLRTRIQSLIIDHPEFIDLDLKLMNNEIINIRSLIEEYVPKPGTSLKVRCIENNVVYDSCRQAAISLDLNPTSITRFLKGKQKGKIKKQYSFEYMPVD